MKTRYEVLKHKIELLHSAMMRTLSENGDHTAISLMWFSKMSQLKYGLSKMTIRECLEVSK